MRDVHMIDSAASADSMSVVRSRAELDSVLRAPRAAGRRIGFVPTMGALHEGHCSLVEACAATCDVVVVSCYVNPTQFGPGEDLERYPRSPESDARLAAASGAQVLWLPSDVDVYGSSEEPAATVHVGSIGEVLEGASRPGHFDGVASVVVRLLQAVRPEVLILGAKDYQQAVVVRHVIAELDLPVQLMVAPTVRDADGLACSSRNTFLSAEERAAALAIPRALDAAEQAAAAAAGGADAAGVVARAARDVLAGEPAVDVDYVAVVDAASLEPVRDLTAPAVLLVAARVGSTRLIDNRQLPVAAPPTPVVLQEETP